MDDREHEKTVRSEIETPRPAPSIHAMIGAVLVAMLIGMLVFQFWPGDTNRTAVTDSSTPVYRAPTTPTDVKPPTDPQQIAPKAPAQ